MSLIPTFLRFLATLVTLSFHTLTPFWLGVYTRLLGHPTARTLVARVGRGGTKSYAACVFGVFWTLYVSHTVPPGERHFFAFVSVSRDEAAQRLRLIESMLTALRVPFTRNGETIDLGSLPLGFKVFTCSVAGVSGFRCIGWVADEAAKWKNNDTGANPAEEVIASLRAMTVTHPEAIGLIISSPLACVDYHFELFEQGNNEGQIVAFAPTWEANPSISEEQTHKLERNHRIWSREYAAIPAAAASPAFETDDIKRSFGAPEWPGEKCGRVVVIDASSGREDEWAYGVIGWNIDPDRHDRWPNGDLRHDRNGRLMPRPGYKPRPPYLTLDAIGGFDATTARNLGALGVANSIRNLANKHHAHTVIGDQREAYALGAIFRGMGLNFREVTWSNPSKQAAVEAVREWMANRRIFLADDETLREQLLAYEERFTSSGAVKYGGSAGRHDDRAALIVTAAMADQAGMLPGSPYNSTPAPARGVVRLRWRP